MHLPTFDGLRPAQRQFLPTSVPPEKLAVQLSDVLPAPTLAFRGGEERHVAAAAEIAPTARLGPCVIDRAPAADLHALLPPAAAHAAPKKPLEDSQKNFLGGLLYPLFLKNDFPLTEPLSVPDAHCGTVEHFCGTIKFFHIPLFFNDL